MMVCLELPIIYPGPSERLLLLPVDPLLIYRERVSSKQRIAGRPFFRHSRTMNESIDPKLLNDSVFQRVLADSLSI